MTTVHHSPARPGEVATKGGLVLLGIALLLLIPVMFGAMNAVLSGFFALLGVVFVVVGFAQRLLAALEDKR